MTIEERLEEVEQELSQGNIDLRAGLGAYVLTARNRYGGISAKGIHMLLSWTPPG